MKNLSSGGFAIGGAGVPASRRLSGKYFRKKSGNFPPPRKLFVKLNVCFWRSADIDHQTDGLKIL
jgi:hypothetical protein